MRVAVLAAMPLELRPFAKAVGLRRTDDLFTGKLGGLDIVATIMGVGMTRAAHTAEHMVAARNVDLLVVIGICGGIDPALPIGHVITPEVVVDGATRTEYRPPAWGPIEARGRIVTYDDFDAERRAMGELQQQGFAGVDMETAAVAAVCARQSCPYAVFRAISDNATDGSVDAAVAAMARPDGTPDTAAALRYMLRRPWSIPRLLRLGRGSQLAARNAAAAAIRALRGFDKR
jgi:adenosylhomocysteine nucleosidase